ncbi:hypothetical protein V2J09_022995 [Rumex salicifolius]
MEGWLLLIKSNRFSLQNIRKKYFVLEDFHLKSFNTIPNSNNEYTKLLSLKTKMQSWREATIDSCIRVTDNGRRNIHNKAFFLFTVYHTSNHKEQLKVIRWLIFLVKIWQLGCIYIFSLTLQYTKYLFYQIIMVSQSFKILP